MTFLFLYVTKCLQDERHLSQIFHLRNMNNWIKAVLIGDVSSALEAGWSSWAFQKSKMLEGLYSRHDGNYPIKKKDLLSQAQTILTSEDAFIKHELLVRSRLPLNVLDFGCGKGGDVEKWLKCDKGNISWLT